MPEPTTTAIVTLGSAAVASTALTAFGVPLGLRADLLIALDQLAYILVTLCAGSPDETLSAAAWRTEQEGRILGRIFRPLIDLLARPWERDHCRTAFESERLQRHLPKEYRP